MLTAKIPFDFLSNFSPLTWRDIEFGLSHSYISPAIAIDLAQSRIGSNSQPDAMEAAIAKSSKDDPMLERVGVLAARELESTHPDVQAKWLCILLTWVYENRTMFDDPLGIVEEIYTDFDYPEEIEHLISYMPNTEPDLGSKEANLARLFSRWHEFTLKCRQSML